MFNNIFSFPKIVPFVRQCEKKNGTAGQATDDNMLDDWMGRHHHQTSVYRPGTQRIFCLPVCYPKIQPLRYTEL